MGLLAVKGVGSKKTVEGERGVALSKDADAVQEAHLFGKIHGTAVLGNDEAAIAEKRRITQRRENTMIVVSGSVGRIKENKIEWSGRSGMFAGEAIESAHSLESKNACARINVERGKILLDEGGRGRMILDEDDFGGTAAERFDTNGSGARKNVHETGTRDAIGQNIEECFSKAVARGTKSQSFQAFQGATAKFSGNDAHRNLDCPSADVRKMVAALPFGRKQAEHALQVFFLRRLFHKSESFLTGNFQELAVAQRTSNVKAEFAGLARAKKFAGSTDLQIGFSDVEAVGGADHGLQARARVAGHTAGHNKDAMRFLCAAANAPAELVQLGEPKALRVLDDHDGGVGNIHTNFDDRRRDEDLHFITAEFLHDVFFFVAGEAAVKQAELEIGENGC